MHIRRWFALLAAAAIPAFGQAAAEHAVTSTLSAPAAAAAKGVGKSTGAVLQGAAKALAEAARSASNAGATASRSESIRVNPGVIRLGPEVTTREIPGPASIPAGLARAELIERYGPPLLATTGETPTGTTETCWYPSVGGQDRVVVGLRDGKVVSALLERSIARREVPDAAGITIVQ